MRTGRSGLRLCVHCVVFLLLNAQKHIRVLGSRDFADPFSSAASFDGFMQPPATFEDETPWRWVKPRTWLLGVGWRRYGLLDPAESPRGGSTSSRL